MGFKSLVIASLLFAAPVQAGSLKVGDPAPQFSGSDMMTGAPLRLADYRGKIVLVDFWASWCPPCVESLPAYERLRNDIGTGSFEIIAINVDEKRQDALDFLDRHTVSYPILADPEGAIGIPYGIRTLPRSFLLDRQGRIRAIYVSFSREDEARLRQRALELIAE